MTYPEITKTNKTYKNIKIRISTCQHASNLSSRFSYLTLYTNNDECIYSPKCMYNTVNDALTDARFMIELYNKAHNKEETR